MLFKIFDFNELIFVFILTYRYNRNSKLNVEFEKTKKYITRSLIIIKLQKIFDSKVSFLQRRK